MNDWLDELVNAAPVRAIYGEVTPMLEGIDLHEVTLHRDGPSVLLRFDLHQFPEQPPKKWAMAGFNRVQLKLVADGVHKLDITGLQRKCVMDISILKTGDLIFLSADNGEMKIRIVAEHLLINQISAYCNCLE